MGKICILAFSGNGVRLAEKLNIGDIFIHYKYKNKNRHIVFKSIRDIVERCWKEYTAIVFISDCGTAIRSIAPYVKYKTKDPAVIVCDELGRFAVSLLVGANGSGNEIAEEIGNILEATSVITTTTDILSKFSPEMWAKDNGLVITDTEMTKKVTAAITKGYEIGYKGSLPKPEGLIDSENAEYGIFVGYTNEKPFKNTLTMAEKSLILGIGCKSKTPYEEIRDAIIELFKRENLNLSSVKMVASLSIMANEEGIIKAASDLGVNFATYSAHYLENLQGKFSYTEYVKRETGIDCICERAALAKGGKLIVKMHRLENLSLAVARN